MLSMCFEVNRWSCNEREATTTTCADTSCARTHSLRIVDRVFALTQETQFVVRLILIGQVGLEEVRVFLLFRARILKPNLNDAFLQVDLFAQQFTFGPKREHGRCRTDGNVVALLTSSAFGTRGKCLSSA
jgi:hypothetical protein